MKITRCDIDGPLIVEPRLFGDDRGFFFESWNAETFRAAGLDVRFVQDNHSRSAPNVLRGLHFQNPTPQGKLLRVVAGSTFHVAVDLRRSSPTFARWIGVDLSADNRRMFWVPEGFAHGFLAGADGADVVYKCTAPYAPASEHILAWNDPDLALGWPLGGCEPLISDRDRNGLALLDVSAFR